MNNMGQNEKKLIIIGIGITLLLVVVLNIFIFFSAKHAQNSSPYISIPQESVKTTPAQQQGVLTPTPSVLQLQKLKANLSTPIKANNLTIEYRKSSNVWVVFFNGDKAVAQENMRKFFLTHNITSYSSEIFDYISLDPPKDMGEK
jgi:hypothetical protein